MRVISKASGIRFMLVALTVSASGAVFAQEQGPSEQSSVVVNGVKTAGPEVKGVITARNADRLKVTTADGASTVIAVNDATQIRAGGGLREAFSREKARWSDRVPISSGPASYLQQRGRVGRGSSREGRRVS